MKKLLIFILLSLPAFGQVARSGSCSAATTSCTFSAINTGDLKLVYSFNGTSNTVPSLAAGWHSILQNATATGGVTAAARLSCNVATSSSDTSTGTWTNATFVAAIAYSGTQAVASTCATNNIGATSGLNAKTSTSLRYNNMTLNQATSWVTGWAGDTAGAVCVNTGLTSVTTNGSGPGIGASDTNGQFGSTTWGAITCTVTSGTWVSMVAEVLQPVTPTFPPVIY